MLAHTTSKPRLVAQYSLLPTASNKTLVDRNANGKADLSDGLESGRYIDEPVLDIDLTLLKEYASMRTGTRYLSKRTFGEVSYGQGEIQTTRSGLIGGENNEDFTEIKNHPQGTLTELSRELNHFPPRRTNEEVAWMIDIGTRHDEGSTLYIVAH